MKAERIGNGFGIDNGLSWTFNSCLIIGAQKPVIIDADKHIIRELAKLVASLAAKEEQLVKKGLWLKYNALQETRPLIFCDSKNVWHELILARDLKCKGGLARIWKNKTDYIKSRPK